MTIKKTISQAALKKNNIGQVLNEIKREGCVVKTTLAKRLQLSFATVSSICETLEREGFITMEELGVSTGGRKPVTIKFNPNSRFVVTINMSLNGTIHIALVSLDQTVIGEAWLEEAFSSTKEALFKRLEGEISGILAIHEISLDKILGIGVAVPGLYDGVTGLVNHCTNPALRGVHIEEEMQKFFNLPIYIMNDANLAAFGQWSLLRDELSDLLLLYFSQGIGLGIIQDRDIFMGSRGYAGELGSIRLSVWGEGCNIEEYLNLNGIAFSYKEFLERGEIPKPQQVEKLSPKERHSLIERLVDNLEKGREGERLFIKEIGEQLGWIVSILIDILNPSAVFVGGDLDKLSPYLLPHIQDYYEKYSFTAQDFAVPIKQSAVVDLMVVGLEEFVFKSWLSATYSLLT
ncbi:MAG: ROK family transcriptional regulator [Sphaerochaetaceae bacterium]|nr:ROK family transcriptional regulator [Sphaerochaetaceae bacterium]